MHAQNILSLFMILLPVFGLAEYNGHQIEFTIELKDGQDIHGYNFLADVYQRDDSISYEQFLEMNYELVLGNQFYDDLGELTYYQNRIRYEFTEYGGTSNFIYTLTDKKGIDKDKVKALNIIGLTEQSYAIGVSSFHVYEDRLWMDIKPIEQFAFGGIFCSHEIFIHEKSAQTDNIIQELQILTADFEAEIKELEQEMKYADGEHYYRAETKLEHLEEEIDEKVSEIVGKFGGLRVVVITMCTC